VVGKLQYGEEGNERIIEGSDGRGVWGGGSCEAECGQGKCRGGVGVGGWGKERLGWGGVERKSFNILTPLHLTW